MGRMATQQLLAKKTNRTTNHTTNGPIEGLDVRPSDWIEAGSVLQNAISLS